MGMNWTYEQQKVIDLRNRNILVSAAAGSGKTAVLVERIVSMIMDKNHPTDIDRLLIVTFTRAAANEMRERIGAALEKKLEEYPDNEHLQKQTTLLHHAQINTIDGFCSYVIQNYFHMIDLDPGYRMADEGEIKLLKADVAKDVLEEYYEASSKEYTAFVESYATGKTDEGIADLIWDLYEFASSAPWPDQWLREAKKNYQINSWEDIHKHPWMKYLWQDLQEMIAEIAQMVQENLNWLSEPGAPVFYEDVLKEDAAALAYVASADTFEEMYRRMPVVTWSRLPGKKDPQVDIALRERIKDNRGRAKDMFKELQKQYFFAPPEQMLEAMKGCEGPVSMLIDLTLAFSLEYEKRKREKNMLDFSDLEHQALKILLHIEEDGLLQPSHAAKELSGQFDEILIDEYQDSNLVQEYLLTQVSAAIHGGHNTFMVGDVKQSIYRFRQARPELFMEKLDTYSVEDSDTQRIDLHKNFRSRKEVLTSVNYFFWQIMRRELGGVEYDKDAALYTGAVFPEGNDAAFSRTEVIAIETDQEDLFEEGKAQNKKELEARAIGSRIRQIVGKELVWDKKKEAYRPARYSDCVVLLRTMSGWAEVFGQTLIGMGIPAYSTSRAGYFSALEVQTVLNFLQICDNPRQDIPYTAVLASPFAGCTPKDLARIKCMDKKLPICLCAEQYAEAGEDEVLRKKIQAFFVLYKDICEKKVYTPIHELIWYLIETSGYGDYASALPGGEQRIANLRMLVEKAVDYEKTSYGGLYHFIRYIDHLKKYEVDFGEANIVGENDNTVRIMSIHKSKGLEFPVVFVAGLEKRFNQQDLNGPVLMDADFGVASSYIDYEHRVKSSTIMRGAIRRKLIKESLGEELRVLYVAMTRAKEKLILTGTISRFKEKYEKYQYLTNRESGKLPVSLLMDAGNYWQWILPALVRVQDRAPIDVIVLSAADLVTDEARSQSQKVLKKEELLCWDGDVIYDDAARRTIWERFSYEYPHAHQQDIPVKVSVSELKKKHMEEDEAYESFAEPEIIPLIPEFMKTEADAEETIGGAARGTAYHAFMERVDLSDCESEEAVIRQILRAKEHYHLSEEEAKCISPKAVMAFVQSSLGQRMCRAQRTGLLKREQPFVLGLPALEVNPQWAGNEIVLVQGIIDGYFYEDDKIVLMDYKTDKVSYKNGAKELADKYKVQLQYYAQALERLTGKKVKEKIIYSFTLNREIAIISDVR